MWMLLSEATRGVSLVIDQGNRATLASAARWVFVFEPTPGRVHNLLVMGLVRAVDGDLCEASGASTWPSAT